MTYISDLKLEEDILPCFNYTNHEESRLYLLELLQNKPTDKAVVLERQAVIRGMLDHWHLLEHFTYRRLDLSEVHQHFEHIIDQTLSISDHKLQARLALQFSETARNALRSKLVQMVLLLHGLHGQYLARLDETKFPAPFSRQLQTARSFLTKLRLEKQAALIQEDRFSVKHVVTFMQLLQQLNKEEIKAFWKFFSAFEAYWSIARGTRTHDFSFPEFDPGALTIEDFYHPHLKNPVKNSLTLAGDQNILLLTGPNMSGKSTMLKALGVCVYLAHTGFPVPASFCSIPYFNTIAIAINLSDSLRDGYSHFMAEIANLKRVVQAAEHPQKCFAIFDEIFRGTNTDDALDITQATLEGLSKLKNSCFLISTHLLQLDAQLQAQSSLSIKKCYIECELAEGLPRFSYTLKEGWSQLRIGRILFDKEGLSQLLQASVC